jgi:hypothetical protein
VAKNDVTKQKATADATKALVTIAGNSDDCIALQHFQLKMQELCLTRADLIGVNDR